MLRRNIPEDGILYHTTIRNIRRYRHTLQFTVR
jgi:hypothetical protein